MPRSPLAIFGKLIVTSLRDRAIDFFDMAAEGKWKAPALQSLQSDLSALTTAQRQIVRKCVIAAIDSGMHDFLFALQTNNDAKDRIEVLANGQNVAELSDGLHGEQFGKNGWITKFGKYPEEHG